MNKFIYIATVLLSLTLFSCSDRYQSFEEDNSAPNIAIAFAGTQDFSPILDTRVKISLKSSLKVADVVLDVSDLDGDIQSLTYNFLAGDGIVSQNNSPIEQIDFTQEIINVQVEPTTTGTNRIEFIVTDQFSNSSRVTLEIEAFINDEPIAVLSDRLEDLGVVDPFEFRINASDSFDQDGSIGGGIQFYRYTVQGNTHTSTESSIPVIFPGSGNYTITLQVQDSDGVWSDEVERTYTIN